VNRNLGESLLYAMGQPPLLVSPSRHRINPRCAPNPNAIAAISTDRLPSSGRQGRVGRFRHSASRDSTQISVTAGTVSSLRLYPQATPISKPVASMVALHRIDEGTGIEPGEPA
jgi:hypothetical protein